MSRHIDVPGAVQGDAVGLVDAVASEVSRVIVRRKPGCQRIDLHHESVSITARTKLRSRQKRWRNDGEEVGRIGDAGHVRIPVIVYLNAITDALPVTAEERRVKDRGP